MDFRSYDNGLKQLNPYVSMQEYRFFTVHLTMVSNLVAVSICVYARITLQGYVYREVYPPRIHIVSYMQLGHCMRF